MTQQTDRLNTALAGRYRIERHLGEGGMASVYLCEDLKHDRKVALKLLKPELAAVLGADRFVVEIKTTASLQHPHILPLFDSGTADGFLFYVMPFIEGETLRDKLNRDTQLGVDEAVRIAREVLDALEYAHQHGIVHRDVKPENILLHGGHAMVADFGIALAVSAAAGGRMTETGLSLGTPHYMSPEQATAEKEITPRSDVYSLGSVLFEMLAGQPPHIGGSAQQIIMKIITEAPQSVTQLRKSVPPNVAAAVSKSLEKLPADRFESARVFSEALANVSYTRATMSGAAFGQSGSPWKFNRLAAALCLVVAGLFGAIAWNASRPALAVVSREQIVLGTNPQWSPGYAVGVGVAISPDGETVIYVDSSTNGTQLVAKERSQLDAVPIAGTTGAIDVPAFSPDGAWLAFVSNDRSVRKVPRHGGAAMTLADSAVAPNPGSVAWLDDGSILYVDTQGGLHSVRGDGTGQRVAMEPTMNGLNGLAVGVMTLHGAPAALVMRCAIGCTKVDVGVLDVRTGKTTLLADQAVKAWSLSGGLVAFVRQDGGVFAGPFDVNKMEFTRTPMPIFEGVRVGYGPVDMAVSTNGTVIYVAGGGGRPTKQTEEPVFVTRNGAITPVDSGWTFSVATGFLGRPAFSPDGRRLALHIARDNSSESDIWIKQLGGPLTRLTFDGNNYNPEWNRDGSAVTFAAGNEERGFVLRRSANGAGAVDTLLRNGRRIAEAVPTKDSSQFVLRFANQPTRDIVRGRIGDTTTVPLIATQNFEEVSPALSPDGRWLAYVSNESTRQEVYVRPYPDVNSGRWQVSRSGGITPRWAHSGRELFYVSGDTNFVAAAVTPGATFMLGAQTVLFSATKFSVRNNVNMSTYDVAPDDKRFVMLQARFGAAARAVPAPARLVQITNWLVEVQAKLAGKASAQIR